MQELWKPIDGFCGYEVSNIGNIRSYIGWKRRGLKEPRVLKCGIGTNGYKFIILCREDGKHIEKRIHRLVAEAFIPNVRSLKEVNHINGIKTDNSVENLEWCSRSENVKHAYRLGLKYTSEKQREKIIERARPVAMIDIASGEVLSVYETASLAEHMGVGFHNDILKCCKGISKQHKGYLWRYADEYKT